MFEKIRDFHQIETQFCSFLHLFSEKMQQILVEIVEFEVTNYFN